MHKKFPKIFIFINKYNEKIFSNINTHIGVIYRNYNTKNHFKNLSLISRACKKNKVPFFVANNLSMALKFRANGIYISAYNKLGLKHLCLNRNNFQVLGSAHNIKEINEKINQGCQIIFISPLFKTKSYKKFLGILKFNLLTNCFKHNFYALGGINAGKIKKLRIINCLGFGGINFAQKKTGLKIRPVFNK